MPTTPVARNGMTNSGSRQPSPVLNSPRAGPKRLRVGDVGFQNGNSGTQTPTPQDISSNNQHQKRFVPDASIVLVGIRGSGKRSLGFIAAAALGRRFITEDHFFVLATGLSRQDYLRIHGSEEFYRQDVEISRRMLEDNRHGCVIDCGLGSLTRALQEHLKTYCRTNPVIYIQRDISAITELLKLSEKSAKMLEAGDVSHRRCSNFEFYNVEDDSQAVENSDEDRANPTYSFKLQKSQTDFSNFVQSITRSVATPPADVLSAFSSLSPIESKLFTHALCIPISTYRGGTCEFTKLESGGDMVEIKIDEWQEGTARLVSRLAAEVRRYINMPIMVSAIPISDQFPVNVYFSALRHALRLAPEYLLVDLTLERNWIAELASTTSCSRLMGSIRYQRAATLLKDSDKVIALLEKALSLDVNLVRIVARADSRNDEQHFDQFIRALRHRYASRLWFSAYLTGPFGRTSQVFNPVLTAVTHQSLRREQQHDTDIVPDITSFEALRGLVSSFTLDPLHFFVFGANVSSSLSPAIHNSAYKAVGLPHDYTPVNLNTWEEIKARAQALDFGGASIAQPFKVKIVKHLSYLSDHARGVGAINTLVPIRGEPGQTKGIIDQAAYRNRSGPVLSFYGDNSDWLSIQITLKRNLSPRNVIHSKTSALVVGAGGMARAACYALLQSGCRNIFIHNRTVSNAISLAHHFTNWCATQNYSTPALIKVLETTSDAWPEGFAQPTIIISCVTHERIPGEEHAADFTVPEQWLGSETGGAAVEQSYYLKTPFIQQMAGLHASTGKPWVVVDGLEVLHAQACSQFEIMTGRKAPKTVMWNALQEAVQARHSDS